MCSDFPTFSQRSPSSSCTQWLPRALQAPFKEPAAPCLDTLTPRQLGSCWSLAVLGTALPGRAVQTLTVPVSSTGPPSYLGTILYTRASRWLWMPAQPQHQLGSSWIFLQSKHWVASGEDPCTIMCYFVRIEKKALSVLSFPPGRQGGLGQFSMSWSNLSCFNLPVMGWFCHQNSELAGDLLLGPMDWDKGGAVSTNSSGFVWRWSWAYERNYIKMCLSINPRKKCLEWVCLALTT